jgi:uncharacterized membrane protein
MDIFTFFLTIHVLGGTLGLLAGTYIVIAKKGNKSHQLIGKLFSISMLGAGICSLILATIHRNDFLFTVGVFTVYLTSTGWRYMHLKNIPEGQKPKLIDWLLIVFMVLGCIAFSVIGINSIISKEYFGVIVFVFAWRGISFVIQDVKTYNGKITIKNYWLVFHFQRMTGAYIASLTAFAVVNAPDRLSFIPWLLPSVLIVPLIINWTKKYKRIN